MGKSIIVVALFGLGVVVGELHNYQHWSCREAENLVIQAAERFKEQDKKLASHDTHIQLLTNFAAKCRQEVDVLNGQMGMHSGVIEGMQREQATTQETLSNCAACLCLCPHGLHGLLDCKACKECEKFTQAKDCCPGGSCTGGQSSRSEPQFKIETLDGATGKVVPGFPCVHGKHGCVDCPACCEEMAKLPPLPEVFIDGKRVQATRLESDPTIKPMPPGGPE